MEETPFDSIHKSGQSSFFFGNQFEQNRQREEIYSVVGNEMDSLEQIFIATQPFIWPAILATAGFIVRAIVTRKKTKFFEFLLDVVAAVIIGTMVGITINDMDISNNLKYAIISISGMVGPDLAGGIIILGQAFRESPSDFIYKHYNAIRGIKDGDGKAPEKEKEPKNKEKSMTYEEWNQANKDFIDQTFG